MSKMKTWVLTSLSKPLLVWCRQRLSSLSNVNDIQLVVPSTTELLESICAELQLNPLDGEDGFVSMPGVHRIKCQELTLILIRSTSIEKSLSELVQTPDVVLAEDISTFKVLRHLMGDKTGLFVQKTLSSVPPYLEQVGESYRLRQRKTKESSLRKKADKVLIVGGGLAGAMVAYELSQRGREVVLVDAGCVPGSGASALFAGLIHPHWQASDSPLFQLTRAGFEAMVKCLKAFPDTFISTGVMDAASSSDEFKRWQEAWGAQQPIAMPESFAKLLDQATASQRTGLPLSQGGWFYEQAGLVYAGRLVRGLLERSGATVLSHVKVRLERDEGYWVAINEHQQAVASAPACVVCSAMGSAEVLGLEPFHFGLHPLYGRISLLRDTDLSTLKCALTGDGYVAKTSDGFCAVGATYEAGDGPQISAWEAHEHNLQTFNKLMGDRPEVLAAGFYEGIRAVPLDRMPLAGRAMTASELQNLSFKGVPELKAIPRADQLWMCAGFGSRGLTWGLSCAQVVAADICAEPSPLVASLATKLDPARFLPKLLTKRH